MKSFPAIKTPKAIAAIKFPKPVKPSTRDPFMTTVSQDTRRIGGVTPKLVESYQERPPRFIKRTSALRTLGMQKKVNAAPKVGMNG